MSDHKGWLHYIQKTSTGEYYYVDNAGAVQLSATPVPINYGPDGWQEISIGFDRDVAGKIGMARNFTVPLNFVRDGAIILQHLFYNESIENEATLIIKKHRLIYTPGVSYKHQYDTFYVGTLDITTVKDDGLKVSVQVAEGGTAKKVKANSNTMYELDMETDTINVLMDGLKINYGARMTAFADLYSTTLTSGSIDSRYHLLSFYNTSSEQNRLYLALFDVFKKMSAGLPNYSTSTDYFLKATGAVTFDFHFRLTGTQLKSGSGSSFVEIMIVNQSGTVVHSFYSNLISGGTTSAPINIDTTVPITVATDDKLFLVSRIIATGTPTVTASLLVDESNTDISYTAIGEQSIVKAKLPSVVFKALTEKMTGDEADCDDTFVALHDNFVLTTGDALRRISGAKLKTSLDQFYQFQKVVNAAGMGIENNKIVIDEYEHFYSQANPLTLNRVKGLQSSYANDLLFNTVKIGYPEKSIENVNGKYEFNNTLVFDTPVKSVNKELNLVCPYFAQPFAIEFTRINFEGKTTTDNDADNDIFILNVDLDNPTVIDGETVYPLKRETYVSFSGLPSIDTMFNIIGLTPKRLLMKHMKWFNSVLYHFEGQHMNYVSTDRNAELGTNTGSETVIEGDFLIIGTGRLFLPYYLDLDTDGPSGDLVDELSGDPNACFEFGDNVQAFLVKAGVQPDTKQEQAYKLLAAPDTDIFNIHTDAYK